MSNFFVYSKIKKPEQKLYQHAINEAEALYPNPGNSHTKRYVYAVYLFIYSL